MHIHIHALAVEMTVYFDWFWCTESAAAAAVVAVVVVFPPLFVYLFVCYHFNPAQCARYTSILDSVQQKGNRDFSFNYAVD